MSDFVGSAAVLIEPDGLDAFDRALQEGLERPLAHASDLVAMIDTGFVDISKSVRSLGRDIKKELNLEPQVAQVKRMQREVKSLERDVRSLALEVRNSLARDIRLVTFDLDNAADAARRVLTVLKDVVKTAEGLRDFSLDVQVNVDLAEIVSARVQFDLIDAAINRIVANTRQAEANARGLRQQVEGIASPQFLTDIADILEFTSDAITGMRALTSEIGTAVRESRDLAASFSEADDNASRLASSVADVASVAATARAELDAVATSAAAIPDVEISVTGGAPVSAASTAAGGTFDALLNAAVQSKLLQENAEAIADALERAAEAKRDLGDDDGGGGVGASPKSPTDDGPSGIAKSTEEQLIRVSKLREELQQVAGLQDAIRENPIIDERSVMLAGEFAAHLRDAADAMVTASAPGTIGEIEDFLRQGVELRGSVNAGAGAAMQQSQAATEAAIRSTTSALRDQAQGFAEDTAAAEGLTQKLTGESVDTSEIETRQAILATNQALFEQRRAFREATAETSQADQGLARLAASLRAIPFAEAVRAQQGVFAGPDLAKFEALLSTLDQSVENVDLRELLGDLAEFDTLLGQVADEAGDDTATALLSARVELEAFRSTLRQAMNESLSEPEFLGVLRESAAQAAVYSSQTATAVEDLAGLISEALAPVSGAATELLVFNRLDTRPVIEDVNEVKAVLASVLTDFRDTREAGLSIDVEPALLALDTAEGRLDQIRVAVREVASGSDVALQFDLAPLDAAQAQIQILRRLFQVTAGDAQQIGAVLQTISVPQTTRAAVAGLVQELLATGDASRVAASGLGVVDTAAAALEHQLVGASTVPAIELLRAAAVGAGAALDATASDADILTVAMATAETAASALEDSAKSFSEDDWELVDVDTIARETDAADDLAKALYEVALSASMAEATGRGPLVGVDAGPIRDSAELIEDAIRSTRVGFNDFADSIGYAAEEALASVSDYDESTNAIRRLSSALEEADTFYNFASRDAANSIEIARMATHTIEEQADAYRSFDEAIANLERLDALWDSLTDQSFDIRPQGLGTQESIDQFIELQNAARQVYDELNDVEDSLSEINRAAFNTDFLSRIGEAQDQAAYLRQQLEGEYSDSPIIVDEVVDQEDIERARELRESLVAIIDTFNSGAPVFGVGTRDALEEIDEDVQALGYSLQTILDLGELVAEAFGRLDESSEFLLDGGLTIPVKPVLEDNALAAFRNGLPQRLTSLARPSVESDFNISDSIGTQFNNDVSPGLLGVQNALNAITFSAIATKERLQQAISEENVAEIDVLTTSAQQLASAWTLVNDVLARTDTAPLQVIPQQAELFEQHVENFKSAGGTLREVLGDLFLDFDEVVAAPVEGIDALALALRSVSENVGRTDVALAQFASTGDDLIGSNAAGELSALADELDRIARFDPANALGLGDAAAQFRAMSEAGKLTQTTVGAVQATLDELIQTAARTQQVDLGRESIRAALVEASKYQLELGELDDTLGNLGAAGREEFLLQARARQAATTAQMELNAATREGAGVDTTASAAEQARQVQQINEEADARERAARLLRESTGATDAINAALAENASLTQAAAAGEDAMASSGEDLAARLAAIDYELEGGSVNPSLRTYLGLLEQAGVDTAALRPILLGSAEAFNAADASIQGLAVSVARLVGLRRIIGEAYADLPVIDPAAEAAFRAFVDEVKAQFTELKRLGVEVQVVLNDPFHDLGGLSRSAEQFQLPVLATEATGGATGFVTDAENDMFRAVHDFFQHFIAGVGFDRLGEEAAFRVGRAQFASEIARQAFATETRGQNAGLVTTGVQPVQKAALLPDTLTGAATPLSGRQIGLPAIADIEQLSAALVEERGLSEESAEAAAALLAVLVQVSAESRQFGDSTAAQNTLMRSAINLAGEYAGTMFNVAGAIAAADYALEGGSLNPALVNFLSIVKAAGIAGTGFKGSVEATRREIVATEGAVEELTAGLNDYSAVAAAAASIGQRVSLKTLENSLKGVLAEAIRLGPILESNFESLGGRSGALGALEESVTLVRELAAAGQDPLTLFGEAFTRDVGELRDLLNIVREVQSGEAVLGIETNATELAQMEHLLDLAVQLREGQTTLIDDADISQARELDRFLEDADANAVALARRDFFGTLPQNLGSNVESALRDIEGRIGATVENEIALATRRGLERAAIDAQPPEIASQLRLFFDAADEAEKIRLSIKSVNDLVFLSIVEVETLTAKLRGARGEAEGLGQALTIRQTPGLENAQLSPSDPGGPAALAKALQDAALSASFAFRNADGELVTTREDMARLAVEALELKRRLDALREGAPVAGALGELVSGEAADSLNRYTGAVTGADSESRRMEMSLERLNQALVRQEDELEGNSVTPAWHNFDDAVNEATEDVAGSLGVYGEMERQLERLAEVLVVARASITQLQALDAQGDLNVYDAETITPFLEGSRLVNEELLTLESAADRAGDTLMGALKGELDSTEELLSALSDIDSAYVRLYEDFTKRAPQGGNTLAGATDSIEELDFLLDGVGQMLPEVRDELRAVSDASAAAADDLRNDFSGIVAGDPRDSADIVGLDTNAKDAAAAAERLDKIVRGIDKSLAIARGDMERLNELLTQQDLKGLKGVRNELHDIDDELEGHSVNPALRRMAAFLRELPTSPLVAIGKLLGVIDEETDSVVAGLQETSSVLRRFGIGAKGVDQLVASAERLGDEFVTIENEGEQAVLTLDNLRAIAAKGFASDSTGGDVQAGLRAKAEEVRLANEAAQSSLNDTAAAGREAGIDASTALDKIAAAAGGAEPPIDDLGARIAAFGDEAAEAFGSVGTGFGSARNALQRLTRGAVAGLGIREVTRFFRSTVESTSDLTESVSKAEVVFDDAFDSVDRFAQGTAQSLGQARQQALESAATFGNLFTGAGVNREASAQFSIELTELAADIASFNNLAGGSEEALRILRSGLTGEIEPLKRIGAAFTATEVAAKGVSLGLVEQGEEMTEAQKLLARYELILDKTGNAQGDFARTSDDLANQQRILAAEVSEARVEIGESLLPATKEIITAIREVLPSVTDLGSAFGSLAADLARGTVPIIKVLASTAEVLAAVLERIPTPVVATSIAFLSLTAVLNRSFVSGVKVAITAVQLIAAEMLAANGALAGLRAGFVATQAVFSAGGLGLAITAIGAAVVGLVAVMGAFRKSAEEATPEAKAMAQAIIEDNKALLDTAAAAADAQKAIDDIDFAIGAKGAETIAQALFEDSEAALQFADAISGLPDDVIPFESLLTALEEGADFEIRVDAGSLDRTLDTLPDSVRDFRLAILGAGQDYESFVDNIRLQTAAGIGLDDDDRRALFNFINEKDVDRQKELLGELRADLRGVVEEFLLTGETINNGNVITPAFADLSDRFNELINDQEVATGLARADAQVKVDQAIQTRNLAAAQTELQVAARRLGIDEATLGSLFADAASDSDRLKISLDLLDGGLEDVKLETLGLTDELEELGEQLSLAESLAGGIVPEFDAIAAAEERFSESTQAQVDALEAQKVALTGSSEALKTNLSNQKALIEAQEQAAVGPLQRQINALNRQGTALQNSVDLIGIEIAAVDKEISVREESIKSLVELRDGYQSTFETAANGADAFAGALSAASEFAKSTFDSLKGDLESNLEDLQRQFQREYNLDSLVRLQDEIRGVQDSIEGLDENTEVSLGNFRESIESQITATAQFISNINSLIGRGADDLAAFFLSQGQDAASALEEAVALDPSALTDQERFFEQSRKQSEEQVKALEGLAGRLATAQVPGLSTAEAEIGQLDAQKQALQLQQDALTAQKEGIDAQVAAVQAAIDLQSEAFEAQKDAVDAQLEGIALVEARIAPTIASIDAQIQRLNDADPSLDTDSTIASLESTFDASDTFLANIQLLRDNDLDDLANFYSTQGLAGAGALQDLINNNDSVLAEQKGLNDEELAVLNERASNLFDHYSDLKSDAQKFADDFVSAGGTAGRDFMLALADGIAENQPVVTAALEEILGTDVTTALSEQARLLRTKAQLIDTTAQSKANGFDRGAAEQVLRLAIGSGATLGLSSQSDVNRLIEDILKAAGFRTGAIFNDPAFIQVAEDGKPEVLIPLTQPQRALDLARASGLFDVLSKASGGSAVTGSVPSARGAGGFPTGTPVTVTIEQIIVQMPAIPGMTAAQARDLGQAAGDAAAESAKRRLLEEVFAG